MANVLSMAKKIAVITALVEGCSVRSTSRMTGVCKQAILKLLCEVGQACADYQNATLKNIPAKRVQVDEIWSFCYAKQKNVTQEMAKERVCGDVWTFAAIDADTKLVISWLRTKRRGACRRFPGGRFPAPVESDSVDLGRPQNVFVRRH